MIVVKNMQLYIRECTRALKKATEEDTPQILITEELRKELEIWISDDLKYICKKRSWIDIDTNVVQLEKIWTDSSGYCGGWKTTSDNEAFSFYWKEKDATKTIAVKEGLAILYFVKHHMEKLINKRTIFMCDNRAVCEAFEMGSRDENLNKVIRDINFTAVEYNLHLNIHWISTKLQLADEPSRILDLNEEIVNPKVIEWIIKKYKINPNLDVMASFNNKICNRYISRFKETEAIHTNFMSYTPKSTDIIYAFPPKSTTNFTVPKLLQHSKTNSFILIYHVFGEVPPFVPYLPKETIMVRLNDKFNDPTFIPAKKYIKNIGYYKPNDKPVATYAAIHQIL